MVVWGRRDRLRDFVLLAWICHFCFLAHINPTSLSPGLLCKWNKTYLTELLQVVMGKCFMQALA